MVKINLMMTMTTMMSMMTTMMMMVMTMIMTMLMKPLVLGSCLFHEWGRLRSSTRLTATPGSTIP